MLNFRVTRAVSDRLSAFMPLSRITDTLMSDAHTTPGIWVGTQPITGVARKQPELPENQTAAFPWACLLRMRGSA